MSKFADDLMESLEDALAHAQGHPSGVKIHTVEVLDVLAIRRNLHMSQETFAATYLMPLATFKIGNKAAANQTRQPPLICTPSPVNRRK